MQTVHLGVGTATIHRMIANFRHTLDGSSVDGAVAHVAVGVAVVSLDALTAGAVPDPLSDFNQDWYYWTGRFLKHQASSDANVSAWDVDIRSRRRLRGGYALMMAVETPVFAVDQEMHVGMRNLWTQEA